MADIADMLIEFEDGTMSDEDAVLLEDSGMIDGFRASGYKLHNRKGKNEKEETK